MNESSEILFVEEVADRVRTSATTVRKWIRRGQLPARRIGRRLLVRRADLDRLIGCFDETRPAA